MNPFFSFVLTRSTRPTTGRAFISKLNISCPGIVTFKAIIDSWPLTVVSGHLNHPKLKNFDIEYINNAYLTVVSNTVSPKYLGTIKFEKYVFCFKMAQRFKTKQKLNKVPDITWYGRKWYKLLGKSRVAWSEAQIVASIIYLPLPGAFTEYSRSWSATEIRRFFAIFLPLTTTRSCSQIVRIISMSEFDSVQAILNCSACENAHTYSCSAIITQNYSFISITLSFPI